MSLQILNYLEEGKEGECARHVFEQRGPLYSPTCRTRNKGENTTKSAPEMVGI